MHSLKNMCLPILVKKNIFKNYNFSYILKPSNKIVHCSNKNGHWIIFSNTFTGYYITQYNSCDNKLLSKFEINCVIIINLWKMYNSNTN